MPQYATLEELCCTKLLKFTEYFKIEIIIWNPMCMYELHFLGQWKHILCMVC